MKSSLESIANFIGAAIWASGEYGEAEKETAVEIANTFELDQERFMAKVDTVVNEIDAMDEAAISDFLAKASDGIEDSEVGPVFEAVMEMAMVDGVLTENEVNTMLAMADALGMETTQAVMLLCDMVKNEPDIEIDLSVE